MGVREGLLALLHPGPSHGYQLRGDLEATVAGLWSVNIGQVYSTLQRLERDGLIVAAGAADADSRVPYRLTDAGREAVTRWFTDALPRRDDVRDDLVLKVLLARRSGLLDPQVVIDGQRTATMQALQAFTRRRTELSPTADLEELLSLDRLALRARAELDWLDLVEQRLESAPDPPRLDRPDLDETASIPPSDIVPASAASEQP